MIEENFKKYVLVVGGSGGLGKAICNELKKIGLIPIIGWCNNEDKALEIAEESNGIALKIDLLNPIDSFTNLDKLNFSKNIIGVIHSGSLELKLEKFSKINENNLRRRIDMDIFGTWHFMNMAIKKFLKPKKKGFILFVLSSVMGNFEKASMPSLAGYVIGKYSLAGISSAMGADNKWLKVLTISPGFIDTPMLDAFDSRFVNQLRIQNKISSPKDIANEVIFLIKENLQ